MLQVICRPEATNKEEAYTFHTVHRKRVSYLLQNMCPEAEQMASLLNFHFGISAACGFVALKPHVSAMFEKTKSPCVQ